MCMLTPATPPFQTPTAPLRKVIHCNFEVAQFCFEASQCCLSKQQYSFAKQCRFKLQHVTPNCSSGSNISSPLSFTRNRAAILFLICIKYLKYR